MRMQVLVKQMALRFMRMASALAVALPFCGNFLMNILFACRLQPPFILVQSTRGFVLMVLKNSASISLRFHERFSHLAHGHKL